MPDPLAAGTWAWHFAELPNNGPLDLRHEFVSRACAPQCAATKRTHHPLTPTPAPAGWPAPRRVLRACPAMSHNATSLGLGDLASTRYLMLVKSNRPNYAYLCPPCVWVISNRPRATSHQTLNSGDIAPTKNLILGDINRPSYRSPQNSLRQCVGGPCLPDHLAAGTWA